MMRARISLLALLLTLAATHALSAAHAVVGQGGFAVTSCAPTCTSVYGCWRVPNIGRPPGGTITANTTFSVQWVGIGALEGHLIQTGVIVYFSDSNGTIAYEPYWETINPSISPQPLTGAVAPFDQICATIAYVGANLWNLTLQNVTQGWTDNVNGVSYATSAFSDAEIMSEPQGTSQAYADLPKVSVVPVSGMTVNGSAVNMTNDTFIYFWNARVFPSLPGADGQSGNICYGDNAAYATNKCSASPWAFSPGGAGF